MTSVTNCKLFNTNLFLYQGLQIGFWLGYNFLLAAQHFILNVNKKKALDNSRAFTLYNAA